MKAELKRLHSPDIWDLKAYVPDDPTCFGFLLQVMVGPHGEEGEESFDVQVCTPNWLAQRHNPTDVILGKYIIIVFQYNYEGLLTTLQAFCDSCEGSNWEEIGGKLSKFGKWEFEDYQS